MLYGSDYPASLKLCACHPRFFQIGTFLFAPLGLLRTGVTRYFTLRRASEECSDFPLSEQSTDSNHPTRTKVNYTTTLLYLQVYVKTFCLYTIAI